MRKHSLCPFVELCRYIASSQGDEKGYRDEGKEQGDHQTQAPDITTPTFKYATIYLTRTGAEPEIES